MEARNVVQSSRNSFIACSTVYRHRLENEKRPFDITNSKQPEFGPGLPGPFALTGRNRDQDMGYRVPTRLPIKMTHEVGENYIGPMVTPMGSVRVHLKRDLRVEVTLDHSIRVVNPIALCTGAVGSRGRSVALIHPMGRVYQNEGRVHAESNKGWRAKVTSKGVTFQASGSLVAHRIDAGGVRTAVERFVDLDDDDYSMMVFNEESHHGIEVVKECLDAMTTAVIQHYRHWKWGDVWIINGVRVYQDLNDDVIVVTEDDVNLITSPNRRSISVKTPLLYAAAEEHLFLRRGDRRVHFSDLVMDAKFGPHSAVLDQIGQIKIC